MLIFGGTGFLGKHLCVMLHNRTGSDVTVVSRTPDTEFLNRFAPSVRAVNISDFLRSPESVRWDHRNIVYLAGTSTPGTFAAAPWKEFSENVAPTFHLFEQLHRTFPAAKLVYVSSGGTVYGGGHTRPIPENAPLAPISPYGLGKVAMEQSLEFLNRTEDFNFEILRVSNPVGKWQANPTQGVVNVMVRAAADRLPIKLIGDGSYIRDFLDADDVATAIVKVCALETATNSAWNIGSGVGTAIIDVVRLVEEHFQLEVEKQYFPARALDVHYSVLDCRKASALLDWRADGDVGEMIQRLKDIQYV